MRRVIADEAITRLGPDHPETIRARLAAAQDQRPDEAVLEEFDELAEASRDLPPLHLKVLHERAAVLRALDHLDDELETRQAVVHLAAQLLPEGRTARTSAQYQLAVTLARAGRERAAVDVLDELLRIPPEIVPVDHPGKVSAAFMSVRLLTELADHGRAIALAQQTERTIAAFAGEDSYEHAIALTILADAAFAADDSAFAAAALDRAISARQQALGANDPARGRLLANLAEAQRRAGRLDDAIDTAADALNACSPDSPFYGAAAITQANALAARDDREQAMDVLLRAQQAARTAGADDAILAALDDARAALQ
jgi:tetratricopeptide (TPR) repeat protein